MPQVKTDKNLILINKKPIDCFISLASCNPNYSRKIFLCLICITLVLDDKYSAKKLHYNKDKLSNKKQKWSSLCDQ